MDRFDPSTLKTGDLLLFNNTSTSTYWKYLSDLIKYGTHSNYIHVAMILKDPIFINRKMKGLYVWESSWEGLPDSDDNQYKFGVQISNFAYRLSNFELVIVVELGTQKLHKISL